MARFERFLRIVGIADVEHQQSAEAVVVAGVLVVVPGVDRQGQHVAVVRERVVIPQCLGPGPVVALDDIAVGKRNLQLLRDTGHGPP